MCSKKCAKIILVLLNIIFVIAGLLLLAIGVLLLVDITYIRTTLTTLFGPIAEKIIDIVGEAFKSLTSSVDVDSVKNLIKTSGILIAVMGGVIFLIGFFGCCGAIKENRCFLYLYAGIVAIIIAGEIGGAIYAYLNFGQVEDAIKATMEQTLVDKYKPFYNGTTIDPQGDPFTIAWDVLQLLAGCCGTISSEDYQISSNWLQNIDGNCLSTSTPSVGTDTPSVTATNHPTPTIQDVSPSSDTTFQQPTSTTEVPSGSCKNPVVPPTCCLLKTNYVIGQSPQFKDLTVCLETGAPNVTNVNGCYDTVKSNILKYLNIVLGVVAAIAALEIIGFISVCVLLCKDEPKRDY